MFHVNQEIRILALEPGLHKDVRPIFRAVQKIGEQFLGKKFYGLTVDLRGECREEEIQELKEERGQQFLEEPVVVYVKHAYGGHATARRGTVHRLQVSSEGLPELGRRDTGRRGLATPSSHTTVRTLMYTAVSSNGEAARDARTRFR